jgi:hypothetical protein
MYSHTQKGPICLLFYGISIVLFVAAWLARAEPGGAIVMTGIGTLLALAATCFVSLTVADQGDRLAVRFGPLALFRTEVPYKDIRKVEIEGARILPPGVHADLQGNSAWSLWGRGCVVVHQRYDVLRIGTDDAENLARFLGGKISQNDGR